VAVRSWLAILVMLAACDDHGVARLTSIKSEVCACKTASCAEQAMNGVPKETIKSTHRTQAIARDMLDCLAKLQAAERPTTDPDEEDNDADPPAAIPPPAASSAGGARAVAPAAPSPGAPRAAAPAAPSPSAPRAAAPASAKKP